MDAIDARLEAALREAEPAIGDDGFSEAVIGGMPRKRISNATARRFTLAGAAAVGSFLTSVLGAPVESAFSTFVLEGGYEMAVLALLAIVAVVAIPVAWVFSSK